MKISIFWFRRDLRVADNTALTKALSSGSTIVPIFIFDDNILNELPSNDPRVSFIHKCLKSLHAIFSSNGSSLLCIKGRPPEVFSQLIKAYSIDKVYANKDYEPYAISRDREIRKLLADSNIAFLTYKDHVIHEADEILKKDGMPYTVFTPYKKKWLANYVPREPVKIGSFKSLIQKTFDFPTLESLGYKKSPITVESYRLNSLDQYESTRDFPSLDSGTYLGPHLRFGTIGIREVLSQIGSDSEALLSELIWREFFIQILYHYPKVVTDNFNARYDNVEWLNNQSDYDKWCRGETGYPLVDAGMKQLNETGYMHNRVRMVAASFLCKHLLVDWRYGEAYFAKKLLDYELSSNNGNWQWAAGTGCDAAPYFRIFSPISQLNKFDKARIYVQKFIPNFNESTYIAPIVDHKFARERALNTYRSALELS